MPTRGPLDLLTLAPCQHKVPLVFEEALLMYCKLPSKYKRFCCRLLYISNPHSNLMQDRKRGWCDPALMNRSALFSHFEAMQLDETQFYNPQLWEG
jgi:hypothetical protein